MHRVLAPIRLSVTIDVPAHLGSGPQMRAFDGFCLLNHFHKQISICHSRSHTIRKIAIEDPKHHVLALISLSVTMDLPAHLGSGPQMRAFSTVFAYSTIFTDR